MNVHGGFGILDDCGNRGLLRRSLLWHRGRDIGCLKRIVFPDDREQVPSWSWMSCSGGIEYFSLTWDTFDWQHIQSPWPCPKATPSSNAIVGKVRAIRRSAVEETEGGIIFDNPSDLEHPSPRAIVLGIEKALKAIGDKRHYILVVKSRATLDADSTPLYERIGAGYVLGRHLHGEATTCALV